MKLSSPVLLLVLSAFTGTANAGALRGQKRPAGRALETEKGDKQEEGDMPAMKDETEAAAAEGTAMPSMEDTWDDTMMHNQTMPSETMAPTDGAMVERKVDGPVDESTGHVSHHMDMEDKDVISAAEEGTVMPSMEGTYDDGMMMHNNTMPSETMVPTDGMAAM